VVCVGYVWNWDVPKDLAVVDTTCDIPKVAGFTGTTVPRPVIGDIAIVIGSAAGIAGTSTQGAIANITDREVLVTAQAAPGSSGGALFNRDGQLLGIVQGATGTLTVVIPITRFSDAVYAASVSIAWRTPASVTTVVPTTTTTTLQTTTTTTRAVSPLSIISILGGTIVSSWWEVRLEFRTDATALPQRVCWTVMVNGNAVSNFVVTSADLYGPMWTDSGGGCATYVRSRRAWDDSYWAQISFQYRDASYDPLPYVPRTWTVRATVTDSLGRSAETSTYTRNI
jgi:hypothetical protein